MTFILEWGILIVRSENLSPWVQTGILERPLRHSKPLLFSCHIVGLHLPTPFEVKHDAVT